MSQDYFAILVQPCTTVEAANGLDNIKPVTPLRVRDFLEEEVLLDVLETYHTPSQDRTLQGGVSTIDSGETMIISGAGNTTTQEYAAGYIANPTGAQTYIYIPMPGNVRRAVQWYSGPGAIVAICEDSSPGEMIHVEFGPNAAPNCTYWSGGLSGQVMDISDSRALVPNIDDGQPHKLEVEIKNDYVSAFVDDVAVGAWYDPVVSSIYGTSAMYYSQIRDATDRIYGFEGYSGIGTKTKTAGSVEAGIVQTSILHVGNQRQGTYDPTNKKYIHLDTNGEQILIDAPLGGSMKIISGGSYPVSYQLENQFGHEFEIRAATDASMQIWYQDLEVANISNGGRRWTFTRPMTATTVADATENLTSVTTQLNALLAVLRSVGVINT